ncbi:hypothetical protein GGR51DRAFT_538792 [Nemania sp. FL0031]|nr:hypothetical protein GGR51DRAFT_538792 [Nemania sp. FL0031]
MRLSVCSFLCGFLALMFFSNGATMSITGVVIVAVRTSSFHDIGLPRRAFYKWSFAVLAITLLKSGIKILAPLF